MKIAVHVHSDWSYDGRHDLRMIHDHFSTRGYDAVLMSEHCRTFDAARWTDYQEACRAASRQVMLVPGIEYSDELNCVHVPVWGCEDFLGSEIPTTELLRRCPSGSCFVLMAHPARRDAWRKAQEVDPSGIHAYEMWNRKTDGLVPWRHCPLTSPWTEWHPVVSLDFHTRKQAWPLSVRLETPAPTEERLVSELREGRFGNYLGSWGIDSPDGRRAIALSEVLESSRKIVGSGKRVIGLGR